MIPYPFPLSSCRSHLPQVPVHASTQMIVHNTESVKLLEQYGVKQLVFPSYNASVLSPHTP
ncbi:MULTISPECIES: U32 family peptidase [Methanohalophilus]|uniref:U32 family peptidase n=1 Tax=Methanohalophilus TaxID=2175 RepID=UPI000BBB752E